MGVGGRLFIVLFIDHEYPYGPSLSAMDLAGRPLRVTTPAGFPPLWSTLSDFCSESLGRLAGGTLSTPQMFTLRQSKPPSSHQAMSQPSALLDSCQHGIEGSFPSP